MSVNRGFHGIAQITFSRVTIILYIIYLLYRTFLPYFALYLFF